MVEWDNVCKMFEQGKNGKYQAEKYSSEKYLPLMRKLYERKSMTMGELESEFVRGKISKSHMDFFLAVLGKRNLGWIKKETNEEGYEAIFLTKKAIEDIEGKKSNQNIGESELSKLKQKYEVALNEYFKNLAVKNEASTNGKLLISLNELYELGAPEFIEYAIENYDEVQLYLQQIYNDRYFAIHGDIPEEKVILYDFPSKTTYKIDINRINTSYLNKIVEFEANVIYASPINAILKKAVYKCKECGQSHSKILESPLEIVPEKRNCNKEGCSGEMERVKEEEIYVDFQELHVQQIMNLTEDNDSNREQIIYYENTEGIFSGNVKVMGIVKTIKRQKGNNVEEIIVHAKHIEKIDDHKISLSQEDIENIKKVSKHPNIISKLSNALFNEISGYEIVKKAILLQQIKAVKGKDKRYNSHILLITDPGVGKTKMLRKIGDMGGNSYINMPTSTGNSITAIAEKKNTLSGESFIIKAGTLARTRGTVSIDEIMAVSETNKYLLECMESQVMTIEKGGAKAKFPADNAILAACNPRLGKFDPNMTVVEQIKLPKPILSRFDLIFAIKDENDKNKDMDIAMQILKNNGEDISIEKIEDVELNEEFIKKYIVYAQKIKPKMTDNANKVLAKAYVQMRQNIQNITARQLQAMIRISEQIAKVKLKDAVEEEDAKEAVELINKTFEAIATDPTTGIIDVGKITGDTHDDREKMSLISRIIQKLADNDQNNMANYADIINEAIKNTLTEDEVEKTLNKLINRGDIDEPRSGKYRII